MQEDGLISFWGILFQETCSSCLRADKVRGGGGKFSSLLPIMSQTCSLSETLGGNDKKFTYVASRKFKNILVTSGRSLSCWNIDTSHRFIQRRTYDPTFSWRPCWAVMLLLMKIKGDLVAYAIASHNIKPTVWCMRRSTSKWDSLLFPRRLTLLRPSCAFMGNRDSS